jgi:hypothetical protein
MGIQPPAQETAQLKLIAELLADFAISQQF